MTNDRMIRLFDSLIKVTGIELYSTVDDSNRVHATFECCKEFKGLRELCNAVEGVASSVFDAECYVGMDKALPLEVVVRLDDDDDPIWLSMAESPMSYALWLEYGSLVVPVFSNMRDYTPAYSHIVLLLKTQNHNPSYVKIWGIDNSNRLCSALVSTDYETGVCRDERHWLAKML